MWKKANDGETHKAEWALFACIVLHIPHTHTRTHIYSSSHPYTRVFFLLLLRSALSPHRTVITNARLSAFNVSVHSFIFFALLVSHQISSTLRTLHIASLLMFSRFESFQYLHLFHHRIRIPLNWGMNEMHNGEGSKDRPTPLSPPNPYSSSITGRLNIFV